MDNNTMTTRDTIFGMLGGDMPKTFEKRIDVPAKKATEAQLKFYFDMCEKKSLEPIERDWTTKELSDEIERLKKYSPVSEKQKARIMEYCDILGMRHPDWTQLSGEYNGSASQLIQKLKDKAKDVMPATENQVAKILKMNYCASIPRIEDSAKLTKNQASDHIAKYGDEFALWQKTRLSGEQFTLIEKLLKRLTMKVDYEILIQFDTDQATEYIEWLEHQIATCKKMGTSLEPEVDYNYKKLEPDAYDALRSVITLLYAQLGQDIEESMFEIAKWDDLKELVDFVKLFGEDPTKILEDSAIFSAEQIEALLV